MLKDFKDGYFVFDNIEELEFKYQIPAMQGWEISNKIYDKIEFWLISNGWKYQITSDTTNNKNNLIIRFIDTKNLFIADFIKTSKNVKIMFSDKLK